MGLSVLPGREQPQPSADNTEGMRERVAKGVPQAGRGLDSEGVEAVGDRRC